MSATALLQRLVNLVGPGMTEESWRQEITSLPFWYITTPHCASRLTGSGVWFSREAAELALKQFRHRYPKNAFVYCASAHESDDIGELRAIAKAALTLLKDGDTNDQP